RIFQYLLEAALCGIRFLATNQEVNPANLGDLRQNIRKPDFTDKPRDPDEHDVLSSQGALHGESRSLPTPVEVHNRTLRCRNLALRRNDRAPQGLQRDVQVPRQSLGRSTSVRTGFPNGREDTARTHYRIQQPASCPAIAKLQTVRHESSDSKMLRQWPHEVVKALTDQYNVHPGANQFLNLLHTTLLQPGLELVLEVFFTQQIQSI